MCYKGGGGICLVMYPPLIVQRVDDAIDLMNHYLAPVVQRVNNATHWINNYPVDSMVCFADT